MTDEPIETVSKIAQDCVQRLPTVVLGSGASVAHGIRGMGPLAAFLQENLAPEGEAETDAWMLIRTALGLGDGLEEALQKTVAPASLVEKIVSLTWKAIASDDLRLLHEIATGTVTLPHTQLIQALFRSNANTVNFVTPNYDRVAEYACDQAGVICANGFVPGIVRKREGADRISVRRGVHPARTVRVWKVHGSLDWFETLDASVCSLPLAHDLPEGFQPLVVTPGVSKYERVYDEPFRSALQGSDEALGGAAAFLCIGYGFRDSHIEPRLKERCKQQNVPIVILARSLTDEAKAFLANGAGSAYMALENCEGGTRVYSPSLPEGTIIPGRALWSFDEFNAIAM
jgi:hypothetical protein